MKALVTGASGFVGRYMMIELALNGYSVTGIDIAEEMDDSVLNETLRWTMKDSHLGLEQLEISYENCDILDRGSLYGIIERVKPDIIVHLAAQSSAARSFLNPRETFEVNLFGSLNLFEALKEYRSGRNDEVSIRVLSIGSSDEYGQKGKEFMPLKEDTPLDPVSPYAISKVAQEMLAKNYFQSYQLEIVSTRSFNHTGPMQRESFVLPSLAKQCAMIRAGIADPIIRVGNIDVVRDFMDVRDTVKAYRLLLQKGRAGDVVNVCSGSGFKIADALSRLIELAGIDVKVVRDDTLLRPVDIPVLIGNNDRLCSITGWKRDYSMDDTLSDLLEFWTRKVA